MKRNYIETIELVSDVELDNNDETIDLVSDVELDNGDDDGDMDVRTHMKRIHNANHQVTNAPPPVMNHAPAKSSNWDAYEDLLNKRAKLVTQCPSIDLKHAFSLNGYQKRFLNAFLNSKEHGALAVFSTGTGKTAIAVHALGDWLCRFPESGAVVVCPKPIESKFRQDALSFGLVMDFERVTFTTKESLSKIACMNKFIVFDEVHHLRTIVTEDTGLYSTAAIVASSRAAMVLCMTATPFINDMTDVENIAAIVNGKYPRPIDVVKNSIKYHGFARTYHHLLSNRYAVYTIPVNHRRFVNIDAAIVGVQLPPATIVALEEINNSTLSGWAAQTAALKEVNRRGASLFMKQKMDQQGLINDIFLDIPKADYIIGMMEHRPIESFVVFTTFRSEAGVREFSDFIRTRLPDRKIGIMTSDTKRTDQRERVVSSFNNGEIDVLLTTRVGAEGIDIRNAQNLIITEPPHHYAGLEQMIGYVRRFGSTPGATVKVRVLVAIGDWDRDIEQILKPVFAGDTDIPNLPKRLLPDVDRMVRVYEKMLFTSDNLLHQIPPLVEFRVPAKTVYSLEKFEF